MNAQFHVRVDGDILETAKAVAEKNGTSLGSVFRLLCGQMARRGVIPLDLAAGSMNLDDGKIQEAADLAARFIETVNKN